MEFGFYRIDSNRYSEAMVSELRIRGPHLTDGCSRVNGPLASAERD